MSHHDDFLHEFFPEQARATRILPKSLEDLKLGDGMQDRFAKMSLSNNAKGPKTRLSAGERSQRTDINFDDVFGGWLDGILDFQREYKEDNRKRFAHVEKRKEKATNKNPNCTKQTPMLYIEGEIDGKKLPIFVDSGAQSSVMSMEAVKTFNLANDIDTREAGIATGVGYAKIHGKIWSVPVKIGKKTFEINFMVVEMGTPVILGLQFMKSEKCVIDAGKSVFRIGDMAVPFIKGPK